MAVWVQNKAFHEDDERRQQLNEAITHIVAHLPNRNTNIWLCGRVVPTSMYKLAHSARWERASLVLCINVFFVYLIPNVSVYCNKIYFCNGSPSTHPNWRNESTGNRVLKRIFWLKRDETIGGRRKWYDDELHNLYSSLAINRMIKPRRMMWAGHAARIWEMSEYRVLVGKSKWKRPLGRHRRRWLHPPTQAGSSVADFSTLKMEAIRSSETSVHTRSTRRHIPEDGILHRPFGFHLFGFRKSIFFTEDRRQPCVKPAN
jgi:hypothetical protein